jgi:predicted O-methyltransferase YrrM
MFVAALAHFRLFEHLGSGPLREAELRARTGLAERPFHVMSTVLQAMGLVVRDTAGVLRASPLAREHLAGASTFEIAGYFGQAATDPGVLKLTELLRADAPLSETAAGPGAAYIFRQGIDSAMERSQSARELTLRLAGRARNAAPALAAAVDLSGATTLLDVGGGCGWFAAALLASNPQLRVTVMERPEVLKVAAETAASAGVADRLELLAGDMFEAPWPPVDRVLLSNVLHDWDVPECAALVRRAAGCLNSGGRLLVHDAFLHDDLSGPLSVALYSIALFCLTEGRAYSAAEVAGWMKEAGLTPGRSAPTLIQCSVFEAVKP